METTMQSSLYLQTFIFLIALLFCALFSFLETSITALRLFKLKQLAKQGGEKYRSFFYMLENEPQRVLIAILIANSLANVTSAALITNVMENAFARLHWSSGLGFSVGIGLATVALLIFGEIIPKHFARTGGERYFYSTLWLSNITYRIFDPLASFLTRMADSLIGRSKGATDADAEWVSEREIQFLIEHIGQKGVMEVEKSAMLQNIFELGITPIEDIMVPAPDMIMIEASTSINDTLEAFTKHHFTRLPVYDGAKDNIIGIVHLKDIFLLLSRHEEKKLKDIVRPILFVPESLKVSQLLRELRQQHVHMGIVLNEHGIVTGLITLEDVLEEIVGEISDEHELVVEKFIVLKTGGWLMNASMTLDEVSEVIGIEFETESSNTLGGFLAEELQHLPRKGERVLYKNFYFQVQEATPRRVNRVLVFKEEVPE